MEEEGLIRLILWLVFIAIWIISAVAKRHKDMQKVKSGEAPSPEEIREYFGEDEPPEEPHFSQEDEFRKFLRTLTGEPEAEKVPAKKPAPAAVVRPSPEPVISPVAEHVKAERPRAKAVRRKPKILKDLSAGAYSENWSRRRLKDAIVYSEIVGRPRAMSPYRFRI